MMHHLNQEELAERWTISPRTLERWRWLNEGPSYLKIGGRVAYRMEDVLAYEAQQKSGASKPHKGRKNGVKSALVHHERNYAAWEATQCVLMRFLGRIEEDGYSGRADYLAAVAQAEGFFMALTEIKRRAVKQRGIHTIAQRALDRFE
jgi:hypothetical protein